MDDYFGVIFGYELMPTRLQLSTQLDVVVYLTICRPPSSAADRDN
jgi:hypothetical protein